jgi:integrase
MSLGDPVYADYIRLLLWTGLRREEACALTWREVDFANGVIRLPGSRVKNDEALDLPMNAFVRDMLVARRALGDARWVFPTARGHISDPQHAFAAIADACGIEVSSHDLRRTFITTAESLDISPLAIKGLVNHALPSGDVTGGYVVPSTERLRRASEQISQHLCELCEITGEPTANVTALRRG